MREAPAKTLLFGGLTWKHERLVQGALEPLGYHLRPLPGICRADFDAGKELIDAGACCPTAFTAGNLVRYLRTLVATEGRDAVLRNYAYFTAGGCGPCRFGQYQESYRMALEAAGLGEFELMLGDQYLPDSASTIGQRLRGARVLLPVVWAIMCGDLVTDLECRARPYEVEPGRTDATVRASIEALYGAFRERPLVEGGLATLRWLLTTRHFTRVLAGEAARWAGIEVDRLRVKPRVKVTGEFWLHIHEGDGNYDIKRWLEQEGAEVAPSPVSTFLDYTLYWSATLNREQRRLGRPVVGRTIALALARTLLVRAYGRLRRALGGIPAPLIDQRELARLADPYYHRRIAGGEGHALIGKALHSHVHRTAHMVCELSPYGCLPSTMSVGAMANVLGRHPDLLYASIEVKGDAEVHALSRCQMVLTEAKRRAQREFAETLGRTGLTLERARALEAARPGLRRFMTSIPGAGRAGGAAAYVAHLASGAGDAHRARRARVPSSRGAA
jgi:predicted nucleotide-binding protein (sugar kinase/HSP70/actin superfamily)